MHCSILIAQCRIAALEQNGAITERNAEAAGLQEAAWRLMKRLCVVHPFGRRRSFRVGGLRAGRASRNCMLPGGGQPAYRAGSRNYELRDASLRCQGGIAQSTRGLRKPEVQANGIAGAEELQNRRDCSASSVVPANVLRAGGQRMGCCNYRAASALSCATQSIRQSE